MMLYFQKFTIFALVGVLVLVVNSDIRHVGWGESKLQNSIAYTH